jgi:hypothetical protein
MEKQKLVIIGMSVAGIAGTFLPWATVDAGMFGSHSANGTDGGGDGYITLFFYAMIILISVLGGMKDKLTMKSAISISLLSLLCSVIGFYDIGNINDKASGLAKIGVGLYLVTLMGLAIVGAAFGMMKKANSEE